MTLTLDEVRKTKFHMARRTGYEVSEVDLFVDRVEASFAQLTEENQMLKQQVETLKQAQTRQPQQEQPSEPGPASPRNQGQAQQSQKAPETRRPHPAVPAIDGVQKLVVGTSAEASPAVIRLVQLATEQSEQLVSEASEEARRKLEDAHQKAEQITGEARSKASQLESESKTNADRLAKEAHARADDLDRKTEEERTRRFAGLERERDQLQELVDKLRGFEASYRKNFTTHLKEQLQAVENISVEPSAKPELTDEDRDRTSARRSQQASASQNADTPRLDALANDNQRKS